jgi:phytoene synthase
VATSTEPQLGAIRLAWWRDRLDEIGVDIDLPDEPRIQAADQILCEFTNGAILSGVAESWMALLDPFPWKEDVARALRQRGEELFWVGSCILGYHNTEALPAGALWSLADGAFHCSDPESREFLLIEARKIELPLRMPRVLRPLTVLAALAKSDALGRGKGGRVATAFWHRLTGRFPQY